MSMKAWVICGGCLLAGLFAGLVIGYFVSSARDGSVVADTMGLSQFTHLAQAEERASKAYQHESVPVAIYAMTELLDEQKAVEQMGETRFESRQMISVDLMLTHARLAKLYREAGQTNLSEQHFSKALDCAKADSNLTITNREALMDFLAKIDKGAK